MILSTLDEFINEIKEILIVLSGGEISIFIDNNEFEQTLKKVFLEGDLDIDSFFSSIGVNLSSYYNSSEFNRFDLNLDFLDRGDKIKKILYLYFIEVDSIIEGDKCVKLGFIHIYLAILHFLDVFSLFLKIKKKLSLFFFFLFENKSVIDKSIDTFFFQFEFLMLLDLFYHNYVYSHYKYVRAYGSGYDVKHYPRLCRESSEQIFNIYFKNIGLLNKFESIKCCILIALEKELENQKNVMDRKKYIDSYFVVEDKDNFCYLYDDCIVDFNYILRMVVSLKYSYCVEPLYLISFFKKNGT